MWWFDDIYINLWQWLAFFGLLLFVVKITWDKTQSIFYSILPIICICWLPLVFFHAWEGYIELPSAVFSVLTIWALYEFLEKKEYHYISLGILLWGILSQIKNDGFVVYLSWIVIGFLIILLIHKNMSEFFRWLVRSTKNLRGSVFYIVRFLLPFLAVKMFYGIGFNQAAGVESGVWLSKTIHREIFSIFWNIFIQNDSYNVVLILFVISLICAYQKRKNKDNTFYLVLAPLLIGILFIMVFLLTENYLVAMNQTTINRVFTISFVILFAFIWYLLKWDETSS
jgi:hypothetical protein